MENRDERAQHRSFPGAAGRRSLGSERLQSLITEFEIDATGPIGLHRLTRTVGSQVGDRWRAGEERAPVDGSVRALTTQLGCHEVSSSSFSCHGWISHSADEQALSVT